MLTSLYAMTAWSTPVWIEYTRMITTVPACMGSPSTITRSENQKHEHRFLLIIKYHWYFILMKKIKKSWKIWKKFHLRPKKLIITGSFSGQFFQKLMRQGGFIFYCFRSEWGFLFFHAKVWCGIFYYNKSFFP